MALEGQWWGRITGDLTGTLRLELEDRGFGYVGHAFLFYRPEDQMPAGFRFQLAFPKTPPFVAPTGTYYLHPPGGPMTFGERQVAEQMIAERFGEPMPPGVTVELVPQGRRLKVNWTTADGQLNSTLVSPSNINSKSKLVTRTDLDTWPEFRAWAVAQVPRKYIFRGQSKPAKLATLFHRSWRKDLTRWVDQDVPALFGAVVGQVSYPLQLGRNDHNAVIWALLQHHGYPTPLLDWTFSPFVAAYFAFERAQEKQRTKPRIFIFDKEAWEAKYGQMNFFADASPPHLTVLEIPVLANPRAAPQQALSTVTNVSDIEAFVREREQEDGRTYLTVCDLPPASKADIMRELEIMGITYGSLFPGIDGICRDMRNRLFGTPPTVPLERAAIAAEQSSAVREQLGEASKTESRQAS
jgi:hypothetical protein